VIPAYQTAARKAAAAYPYSQPLALVAAGALLQGAAVSGTTAAELRTYTSLLSAGQFSPAGISLHILLGDFKNPQTAAALPRVTTALTAALPQIRGTVYPQAAEALTVDAAILKTLKGDIDQAAADIQGGLYEARNPGGLPETQAPSPLFLRFAAEFFYDFGDPLRAAELFSRPGTDADIIRQADALWLSGRPENARHVWTILASPGGEDPLREDISGGSASVTARSLYNLALTAADDREAAALFERLAAMPPAAGSGRKYGLIRYSRLLDTPRGLALLEQARKDFPQDPLPDLELLRRRAGLGGHGETWETGRVIGETWLLLGRHPGTEELYRWAAWYFDYQRRRDETARLLRIAARYQFDGPWFRLHEALGSMGEGNLSRAEEILMSIPPETAAWQVSANLGRILEARSAPAAALKWYETAASAVQNREDAARIQLRIARCLSTLGRPQESRRVLEYALDLDPGNLSARLELRRLDN
jgi:tetratricopeptide (TPR) repeat protein